MNDLEGLSAHSLGIALLSNEARLQGKHKEMPQ